MLSFEEQDAANGKVEPQSAASGAGAGIPGGAGRPPLPPDDVIVEGAGEDDAPGEETPKARGPRGSRAMVKGSAASGPVVKADTSSAEWRLLILDTWTRSGLPAGDFLALMGNIVGKHTLYAWKKRFEEGGAAGLVDRMREARTTDRLSEVTRRAIVMMKEAHPEWGVQRISDSLLRGPGLSASATTVLKVLHEAGYEAEEEGRKAHEAEPKRFERAAAQEMWQSDIFTFRLKRQNRNVHLVGFMDDHSRFIVGFGLHATASSALVIETLRAGIANYGPPREVLTDNGTQYKTWRGKSAFAKELAMQGIAHVVASPRHPETLGKIERFWSTLWDDCVGAAVFLDLEDARKRIGHFIDHYNFRRPHQGIGGLVPADRFFGAAPAVLATLKARVAANALELAKNGLPRAPFYVTGQVGGQAFSVHAEGERMIMTREGSERQEVEMVAPKEPAPSMPEPVCPRADGPAAVADAGNEEPPAPGVSPLDEGLQRLDDGPEGGRS
ncbi:MAG: transposase [Planctomycetia bacterium]|nr:transposase [Planctomycetia bacterium]